MVFRSTPGTNTFATAGAGPVKDIFYQNGKAFCLSGDGMYEISAGGTTTKLGTVAAGPTGQLAGNGTGGNQIGAVTGGLGYIYNISTEVFAAISDADFPSEAQTIQFYDGYFLTFGFNTREVFYSTLFDGTGWAAAGKFAKSWTADSIKAVKVSERLIFVIGNDKTEVWGNTGDSVATFVPVQGVLIEHGIDAFKSVVNINDAVAWLGHDKDGKNEAWMVDQNYRPNRFSTHGVERAWRTYARSDDAIAWSYRESGHTFYVISFPTPKKTWAYDLTSGLWHERGYLNPATGVQDHVLGQCHAYAFDRHLVGSRVDGKIYDMSEDHVYDDDSKPILREVMSPHVESPQRSITINRLSLRCDTGVADATGQGADPHVGMKYSVDGGKTFSSKLYASTGEVGEYDTEVGWNLLGQGRDWVINFSSSDPVKHIWAAAAIDAEGDET